MVNLIKIIKEVHKIYPVKIHTSIIEEMTKKQKTKIHTPRGGQN